MEHLDRLRSLIREMIEEETLEEFSGVAGAGGFIGPIGAPIRKRSKRDRRKSKMKESKSLSGQVVGDEDFTFQNHFRYYNNEDSYDREEHWLYYDSVACLARAFAIAENPFGSSRSRGSKNAMRYLQGEIKYPHEA